MKMEDVRNVMASILNKDAYRLFVLEGDSFFIENGELLVAAIRKRDKYTSMLQTLDYWLCIGHTFISIDGKRDKKLSENVLSYPFRVPWNKANWVKPSKLYYDPMSWDSRVYESKKLSYRDCSEIELVKWFEQIFLSTGKAAKRVKNLTIEQSASQIEKKNGDVWVGNQYLKSYRARVND